MTEKNSRKKLELMIPLSQLEKLNQRAKKFGFKNEEEYILFVLDELVREEDYPKQTSAKDQEEMKKKLKALGYI
ncbi:hypothetical protein COX24_01400 [bacterium (Candidatus Gribaldobacteria) CG23_combo_of_CG06-09_8_20_14_all_37_87_8]|uniref:CopG family transcriptional regulator n=2 Tax=Bacteria candidate phyla TaxID=1783234 RepID=A0A2H0TLV5_9BACT|nr:MAG: hypothetical protein COX24_01400 [bacterium (Candidatus Gribaldobacteria) CG23_combo_of_CG06-09_8_20_14_all_37_87_8]PIR73135.1 MAG: hypothetical protein COV26_00085 [Candidatus Nealsonbacteria bacterium CG10_big_fil_rev_8_21_14_0_10_36_23]